MSNFTQFYMSNLLNFLFQKGCLKRHADDADDQDKRRFYLFDNQCY